MGFFFSTRSTGVEQHTLSRVRIKNACRDSKTMGIDLGTSITIDSLLGTSTTMGSSSGAILDADDNISLCRGRKGCRFWESISAQSIMCFFLC
jgi:hypothetical protein